jgi:hypothetical protein
LPGGCGSFRGLQQNPGKVAEAVSGVYFLSLKFETGKTLNVYISASRAAREDLRLALEFPLNTA